MRAEERRQAVLKLIEQSEKPVSAAALASRFSVSRQDGGGDRPGRLGEIVGQRGPALDCVHGGPSSLENLGDI